jgi:dipeptidyl aminopeptidase/acylaminoacyl peptidase
MSTRLLSAAASAAVLLFACGSAMAEAPPPALAFARAALEEAAISPDGSHLALLGATADQKVLNIIGIDDQKMVTVPLGQNDTFEVQWAGNRQMLLGIVFLQKFPYDINHVYHFSRHVILGLDGKAVGKVLSDSDESVYLTDLPILGVSDGDKAHLAVLGMDVSGQTDAQAKDTRLQTKRVDAVRALWRVDAANGKGHLTERGNVNTQNWMVDAAGEPRLRWDFDLTHTTRVMGRPKGAMAYKILYSAGAQGADPDIVGYSDPDDAIYLREEQADGSTKLFRKSLATGAETFVGPKIPSRAVGMLWDDRRLAPLAITYGDAREHIEWLDAEMGAVHASLSKAFKGKTVAFENWSADRKRILFTVEGPETPPSWYMYDAGHGEVSPIQDVYPDLKGAKLGLKTLISYKAADGLTIPAYITMPPGAPAGGGKLPLIVLPHGGPESHDGPGFDFLAQFIATRGYVVLQPQFRGSTGFGESFHGMGKKAWGGGMQTDLVDGVKALAAQGVIDPKRVCIVGWSYGGYAALAGMTSYPETYKCGVSINGVADLQLLIGETIHDYGKGSDSAFGLQALIGDASGDTALLIAGSPARHANAVNGPILLVAGEEDTTVPYEQSVHMKNALLDAGKSVEMVSFKGDDHQLHITKDRVAMMQALEAFLAKNLPVN